MTKIDSIEPISSGYAGEDSLLAAYFQDIEKGSLLTAEEEVYHSKIIQNNFQSIIDCICNTYSQLEMLNNVRAKIIVWNKRDKAFKPKQQIINTIYRDVEYLVLQYPQSDKLIELQRDLYFFCKAIKTSKAVLTNKNLHLVATIAYRYKQSGIILNDLIQEGNIGLMRAALRFNYSKGHRFSTYAVWWIRQAITLAIGDKTRTIRVPSHFREQCKAFHRSAQMMEVEFGRKPNLNEISLATKIPMDKILLILETGLEPISLETPFNEDGQAPIHILENHNEQSPYQHVLNRERAVKIKKYLAILTERQRDIVCLHYGLEGNREITLREIGNKYRVTRECIRQTEKRALRNLRELGLATEIQ